MIIFILLCQSIDTGSLKPELEKQVENLEQKKHKPLEKCTQWIKKNLNPNKNFWILLFLFLTLQYDSTGVRVYASKQINQNYFF